MTAIVTVDLGYGDAGKGSVVEYLARQRRTALVVRFSGGAQASHNVVLADGRHHTFRQFGSASLQGVPTYLSRQVIVEPALLLAEAEALERLGVSDPLNRLSIDRGALVVTPAHMMLNRVKERARGGARHGSCGLGIGETRRFHLEHGEEALFAGDLVNPALTREKLANVADRLLAEAHAIDPTVRLREEALALSLSASQRVAEQVAMTDASQLRTALEGDGQVLFEAAQGVLLDELWGFYPHTTWTNTTAGNAHQLLDELGYTGPRETLGIVRSYMTRHGAGPFVTEDRSVQHPEPHNAAYEWAGTFRKGHLDLVALRYALLATGGVDGLVVTHMDRLGARDTAVCTAYYSADGAPYTLPVSRPTIAQMALVTRDLEQVQPFYQQVPSTALLDVLERELEVPVVLTSHGPTAADKRLAVPALAVA